MFPTMVHLCCKYIFLAGVAVVFLVSGLKAQPNLSVIKGKVTDSKGRAIRSATIRVLNSNLAGITNEHGEFAIKHIPEGKYSIQVSAINYVILLQNITVAPGQSEFSFQLKERGNQLDEVIVTAQKRDEDLQQLPLSISSFSAQQVEDYKLWNIKDITGIIPNLYSASPGDNRNVTSVRGIVNSSYDPSVAVYIDGVNQFGLDTYIAQLQDVERIEVLRGPQGTLYGRNAMGGVINIITKQPDNKTSGFAEADLGNYNQQRYQLALRTPLIKDKLFFGASGLFSKQRGFYTNEFTASDFDDQHSTMGNYYLKFLASPKLSFILNAKHVENRNQGTFPLAGSFSDALSNPFKVSQNNVAELVDNVFNLSLSANYTGRGFNFTSQSAYQDNYRYYKQPIDADFSPVDGYSIVNNYGGKWNKVKVATQEFRFSSAASCASPVKWVAGTYLFYQDNPVKQGTHIGADGALLGSPDINLTSINTNISKGYGAAVFGQGTYAFSPEFNFTVGVRYDYEHKKLDIKGEVQPDGGAVLLTRADTSSTARFNSFTPKASFQYVIGKNNNLFLSYSRGFRAGGISQLSGDPREALLAYKPEFSNNFELGSKNMFFSDRLRINVSLFYTKVNNAQVPSLVLPEGITVTKNAGKLTSKGAELEMGLTPLKGLEVNYSLGLTDAKYGVLNLPSDGNNVNYDRNRQIFTPDMTSLTGLQYGYDLNKRCRLIVRGEWHYTGKQYFDLANQFSQDPYHLFNARLGVSIKLLEVFIWGANLSNRKYVDYAYDFGAAHLGNPRTYGITTRINLKNL